MVQWSCTVMSAILDLLPFFKLQISLKLQIFSKLQREVQGCWSQPSIVACASPHHCWYHYEQCWLWEGPGDDGGVGHTLHTTTVQLLAQAHCRESTEQAGINSSHKLLLSSADFIILEPPFTDLTHVPDLTRYVQYLYNICTRYAHYMYNICTIFAQDMHSICTIFVQYLHNICTVFAQ